MDEIRELKLNNEQLTKLEQIIGEIPTKYGVILINFLNSIPQEEKQTTKQK